MTTANVPMVRLGGPRISASVETFARKLFLALHYRETRTIISQGGALMYWWRSNLQLADHGLPSEIAEIAPAGRVLRRANVILNEQFGYRYGVADDGSMGIYVARFNRAFVLMGLVVRDENLLREEAERQDADIPEDKVLKPFTPQR
jgi:hypothetical protein